MTTPAPGAMCAWDIDTTCCTGWDDYPETVREAAAQWATEILNALTGRRFAQCPVKLRPCGRRCGRWGGYLVWPVDMPASAGMGGPWMIPYVDNGVWRNCGCAGGCRCRATCEARLPYPVASVEEVRVDGLVLDPTAYRLDASGTILVRTDGPCFPECQDLDLPDTEEGTWSVVVRPGEALPASGRIAAGKLACEFAKACTDGEDCALPEQLISLSRNGVQVQVADPQQLLDNGLTGVREADLFIRAYNPHRLTSRPFVLSPDVHDPRQVIL